MENMSEISYTNLLQSSHEISQYLKSLCIKSWGGGGGGEEGKKERNKQTKKCDTFFFKVLSKNNIEALSKFMEH